jgi:DNA excision repair protein ERCC-4
MYTNTVPEAFDDLCIRVDHRERADLLRTELEQSNFFSVEECQLQVGDYAIADLVVERKTIADFYDSLGDGRLFKQLLLMKRSARRKLLVVEGSCEPLAGAHRNKILGALARISAGLQIPILQTLNEIESAQLLQRIALQLYGLTQSAYQLRTSKPTNPAFDQVFFLVGIRGIGVCRAKELLKRFGSLKGVFDAAEQELAEVPNVGPMLADKIFSLLRLPHTE